ncbi:chemotaxis protein CheW [Desulfovibrio sp. OttesenSCG-928-C14]|nr:chemotaxis protein CheW [Desulfovibrio sp. OttesenSCG-928-C14]
MSAGHSEPLTLGTFVLNDREFGVDLLKQREVLRMLPVTRVPQAAPYLEGVINLRGSLIPVVNLRARFGMPHAPFDKMTRIVTIEVTESLAAGFIVDRVGQVRKIDRNAIEPPPAVISSVDADYLQGVANCGETLLLVLDIARLFTDEEIGDLGAVAQ